MKKFLYIALLAVVFPTIFSCEHDLDLKIENTDGVLTMNGYLYTGQDTNVVFLSLTSKKEPLPVSTAKLEMRINGELVETLNSAYRKEGVYILSKKFNAGDKVRIDAYYNGQHAWAEDVAPEQVKDISADYRTAIHTFKREAYSDDYTTSGYNDVDISFSDLSPSNDYYRLNVKVYNDSKVRNWNRIRESWDYDEETDEYILKYWWYDSDHEFYTYEEAYNFIKNNFEYVIAKDGNIFYLTEGRRDYFNFGKAIYKSIKYRYDNDVILSESETQKTDSDLDILLASIENQYRVFSDNQFNNSKAVLHISVPYELYDIDDNQSKVYVYQEMENYPEDLLKKAGNYFTYKIRLELQSISEQQYFYLRALNAVNSDFYEENSDLTGAMKIPSNVSGGCGNISITTRSFYEITVLDNYHPKNSIIDIKPFYD